jgi:hypothetical protein
MVPKVENLVEIIKVYSSSLRIPVLIPLNYMVDMPYVYYILEKEKGIRSRN